MELTSSKVASVPKVAVVSSLLESSRKLTFAAIFHREAAGNGNVGGGSRNEKFSLVIFSLLCFIFRNK